MSIRSMLLRANHRIKVYQPVETRSPMGGKSPGPGSPPILRGDFQPVWVQPASASVVQSYGGRGLTVTHRVFMDVDPGAVKEDWIVEVVPSGRKFLVKGKVDEVELGRLYYLDCLET